MTKNYEEKNSIELLFDEIEKAINAKLYLIALMAALTIPDVLCSIKSGEGGRVNYAKWFDEHVRNEYGVLYRDIVKMNNYDSAKVDKENSCEENKHSNTPSFLCGDTCYQLRCNLLHDLDNRIVGGGNKTREDLDIEECVFQFRNDNYEGGSTSGSEMVPEIGEDSEKRLRRGDKYCYINARGLCNEIVRGAKEYIKNENVSNELPKLKINTGGGKTFEMYDTIKSD